MTDDAPTDQHPTGRDWVTRFARAIGQDDLSEQDVTALLDLAGVAAHSSERLAAPLACYLVGRAGMEPDAALNLARSLFD
ncbi:MAG: DUF6457 domain-containing protein [Actinomycetes bacterium]